MARSNMLFLQTRAQASQNEHRSGHSNVSRLVVLLLLSLALCTHSKVMDSAPSASSAPKLSIETSTHEAASSMLGRPMHLVSGKDTILPKFIPRSQRPASQHGRRDISAAQIDAVQHLVVRVSREHRDKVRWHLTLKAGREAVQYMPQDTFVATVRESVAEEVR
eukprot:96732-Rhodomonas_salina.2